MLKIRAGATFQVVGLTYSVCVESREAPCWY
jgi:hypothetical protein